jgi:hypothetical protein
VVKIVNLKEHLIRGGNGLVIEKNKDENSIIVNGVILKRDGLKDVNGYVLGESRYYFVAYDFLTGSAIFRCKERIASPWVKFFFKYSIFAILLVSIAVTYLVLK